MKKENSTLGKRLKQYSALTGSLLAIAGTSDAQIVYTDVNPDKVLSSVGDTMQLDLDNDGITDYVFRTLQYTNSAGWYRAGLVPSPYSTSNPNQMVGYAAAPFPNGTIFAYPSALAQGATIDDNSPQIGLQDVIFNQNGNNVFLFPAMLSVYSGNPYGPWNDGAEHYAGFKFSPDAGATFYFGWARCEVTADAKTITIKDYAYESNANTGIAAGAGDPSGISSANQSVNFSVFSFEGVVNILVNDGSIDGTTIKVTDMIGETVLSKTVSNRLTNINLNSFSKGIYLVTVQRGDEIFTKKVSFR